jgi:hypothetical protein
MSAVRYESGEGVGYGFTGSYLGPHFGGDLRATLNGNHNENQQRSRDVFYFPLQEDDIGSGSNENESAEAGLQYTRGIFGGVEFEGSALYSFSEGSGRQDLGDATSNLAFVQSRDTTEAIARGILRFPRVGAWTFDGSSEIAKNTLDTQSQLLVNNVPSNALNDPVLTVEELRTETAANARWQYSPTLRYEFGARYETSEITTSVATTDKSLEYLKPRFLVSYTPNPASQYSLRIEKEVSQLSFNDFTASAQLQNNTTVSGNADIVPDQSTVYEARYQWRSGQSSFAVSYTYRDRVDIIDRNILTLEVTDPDTMVTTVESFEINDNVGDGYFQSFAISGAAPLDRFGIPNAILNYRTSWMKSEMTDPITGEKRPISGPPPFQWRLEFTQDLPARGISWGLEASGEREAIQFRPSEIFIRRGDPNFGAFVEYQLRTNAILRVELEDITRSEFTPIREVYFDTRANSGVEFREIRRNRDGRRIQVSLRQNF